MKKPIATIGGSQPGSCWRLRSPPASRRRSGARRHRALRPPGGLPHTADRARPTASPTSTASGRFSAPRIGMSRPIRRAKVFPRASASSRAAPSRISRGRWPSGTRTFTNRLMADPLRKCYMPGVPRATYLPFPFEITQTPNHIGIAYEFAHATRTIFLDGTPHMEDLDFWMGDARGKWEGDTLVVDTREPGRQDLVRRGRKLPQRRAQGRRTLHADRRHARRLRGDDRRRQGVHAAVEDCA